MLSLMTSSYHTTNTTAKYVQYCLHYPICYSGVLRTGQKTQPALRPTHPTYECCFKLYVNCVYLFSLGFQYLSVQVHRLTHLDNDCWSQSLEINLFLETMDQKISFNLPINKNRKQNDVLFKSLFSFIQLIIIKYLLVLHSLFSIYPSIYPSTIYICILVYPLSHIIWIMQSQRGSGDLYNQYRCVCVCCRSQGKQDQLFVIVLDNANSTL